MFGFPLFFVAVYQILRLISLTKRNTNSGWHEVKTCALIILAHFIVMPTNLLSADFL